MRILCVVLHGRLIGGLESVSRDVALSLQRLGHQVSVICTLDPPQAFPGWGSLSVNTLAPSNPFLMRVYFRVWRRVLAQYLRAHRADFDLVLVMHPHAAVSAHWARVDPYWVWTYGIEVWGQWKTEFYSGLRHANHIVAISDHTRQAVLAHLPEAAIETVHPIVDAARFQPAPRPRDAHHAFRILTVGRLVSEELYKGHEYIIRILKPLQRRLARPVEYWIVGEGAHQPSLKHLVNTLGLDETVRFMGRVSQADLVRAYQACDVFAMPSAREGFGIVFLEASACALPVIGGRAGGTGDAILDGVTGCCVNPTSDVELLEALTMIATSPDMARSMGEAGRQRVEAQFSPQVLDRRLAELLGGQG